MTERSPPHPSKRAPALRSAPPPHAPKIAALRAEAAGLLSGEGRQRLSRHVESCAVCAEHLRGARRFHALLGGSTVVPAFDGAAAAQRAHIRSIRARRRAMNTWGGLALAAAAVVLLGIRLNRDPVAPLAEHKLSSPPSTEPAMRAVPEQTMLAVEITALAGPTTVRSAAGHVRPIEMSTQLVEGDVIETGPRGELDLALGTVAGVRIEAGSTLRLSSLRDQRVELRLDVGEVSSQVAKRNADQSYEVVAADHRVAVRGTLFAVRLSKVEAQGHGPIAYEDLSVQCDEGSVAILDANGVTQEVLRAPAHWSARNGLMGLTEVIAKGREYRRVEPAHPHVAGSALLTLPELAGLTGWEIAGHAHSAAELQMRVPRGELSLTALLARDRRETIRVTVDPLGTRVSPAALTFVRDHSADALPEPDASATEIGNASDVIRAGRPALQRCYERSLKNESSGSLSLRLGVVLDAQGRVKKVEPALPEGATGELPAALEQCIRTTVTAFRFAPPGGDGARLEAPLRFQLRR